MIAVTNLRAGVVFEDQGQIYEVLTYEHLKFGRGSANIKVKIKNLKSGAITEKSFISGAKVQEVTLEKSQAQYLYRDNSGFHFMESETFEQLTLPEKIIGAQAKFLQEGQGVELLTYEGKPLSLMIPLKMKFKVGEASPGIRGDSVSNIFKEAVLENGLKVKVPLFIKEGDTVLVDTRTGEYLERVR